MSEARFEVVRQNWQRFPGGWRRLHGVTPVASFPDRESADADATRREEAARAAVNPFLCGIVWTDRTDMPEPVFSDWVGDRDLPAPPGAGGRRDWAAWWELVRPEARAMVWEVLHNLRLHAVREREPGPRLFVLSDRSTWNEYEQEDAPGGGWTQRWDGRVRLLAEGGNVIETSPDRATLERRVLDLDARDRADFHPIQRYDTRRLEDPFTGPGGPPVYLPPEPRFRYRIDEVPLDRVPEPDGPVWIIGRAAFELLEDGLWQYLQEEGDVNLVPVRAFSTWDAASAYFAELNAEIHRVMDPCLARSEWWSGVRDAEPLQELAAAWGLPPLPTRELANRYRPGRVVLLEELARWWEENGADLNADRRAELWSRMGDYKEMARWTGPEPEGEEEDEE